MLNLMFFVKTLALTTLIVITLQVRFGTVTLEDHATSMIRTSAIIQPLQEIAEGGVKVIRNSIHWVSAQVNSQMAKRRGANSEKTSAVEFKRSEAYDKTHSGGQSAAGKMSEDREVQ